MGYDIGYSGIVFIEFYGLVSYVNHWLNITPWIPLDKLMRVEINLRLLNASQRSRKGLQRKVPV